MQKLLRSLGLASLLALGIACGGNAELGEECDDISKTEECVDGAICTKEDGDSHDHGHCRKLCTEQSQCSAGENCNGVSDTSLKSCQPG